MGRSRLNAAYCQSDAVCLGTCARLHFHFLHLLRKLRRQLQLHASQARRHTQGDHRLQAASDQFNAMDEVTTVLCMKSSDPASLSHKAKQRGWERGLTKPVRPTAEEALFKASRSAAPRKLAQKSG